MGLWYCAGHLNIRKIGVVEREWWDSRLPLDGDLLRNRISYVASVEA